ncbi:MAG: DUF1967 domain-containing protein, partial [Clostridia bacterium]|nr:DUF1967 domain-containing protein [Clostridia bacterium]
GNDVLEIPVDLGFRLSPARYFQKQLRFNGVFDQLKKAGIKGGDIVVVGEVEFEYVE